MGASANQGDFEAIGFDRCLRNRGKKGIWSDDPIPSDRRFK
jgi:hypothetical protein